MNDSDKAAMERYFRAASNPFGMPVEFRLLGAKEHNLSSPVIIGGTEYMAAKVSRQ